MPLTLLFLFSLATESIASTAYRGGPAHTGYYPGALAGQGPEGVESVLFVTTQPFSTDVPAVLVALNAADGARLWRRELSGHVTSPAVAGGRILVGSSEGGVTAYAAATGEPDWTFKTRTAVIGQPVVAADVVYFGGGDDHALYAVKLSNGKKIWSAQVKGEGVYSPVRVEGESLYAFSATHHSAPVLYAFETVRGKLLWKVEKLEVTPITGPNDVELAGELLLTSSTPGRYRGPNDRLESGEPTNYAVAFDRASGDEVWRVKTGALACYAPTVSGDTVLFYGRADDSAADAPPGDAALHLLALSPADGAERWRKALGACPLRWSSCAPVLVDDLVYAATTTEVTAFERASGVERWTYPARNAVLTAAGGRLFLVAAGGGLVALEPTSGKVLWRADLRPLDAPRAGPPSPGEITPPSLAD